MSIAVPLDGLRAAIDERPAAAYLLTVSNDGRPHAVHVPVRWHGDVLVARVGKRSAANAAARPLVSLVYPVRTPGDHSLIVDGDAELVARDDARELRIAPTTAILHRERTTPASDPDATCDADCIPILPKNKTAGG